jgi:hypothetical protein
MCQCGNVGGPETGDGGDEPPRCHGVNVRVRPRSVGEAADTSALSSSRPTWSLRRCSPASRTLPAATELGRVLFSQRSNFNH